MTARPTLAISGARRARPACLLALWLAAAACTETIRVGGTAVDVGDGAAGGSGQGRAEDASVGGAGGGTGGDRGDRGPAPPGDGGGDTRFCREGSTSSAARSEWPVAIVVLERSSTMGERLPSGTSKRDAASEAIRRTVSAHDEAVAFGLVFFPGSCPANACCASVVSPLPRRRNGDSIRNYLACERGDCLFDQPVAPLASGLASAHVFFSATETRSPRRVMVVTDGDPTCSGVAGSCDSALARTYALAQDEVVTTVVALSATPLASTCLPLVAQAGGEARPEAPHYLAAADSAQLETSLKMQAAKLAAEPCRLILSRPILLETDALVVADRSVPRRTGSDGEGWVFEDRNKTRVAIAGPACQELKARRDEVRACTRCGAMVVCD